jgi:chromate transporter
MDMMQEVLYSLRPAVVAMIASAGILILMTAFWGNGAVTFVKTKWVMVLIFIISASYYKRHRKLLYRSYCIITVLFSNN